MWAGGRRNAVANINAATDNGPSRSFLANASKLSLFSHKHDCHSLTIIPHVKLCCVTYMSVCCTTSRVLSTNIAAIFVDINFRLVLPQQLIEWHFPPILFIHLFGKLFFVTAQCSCKCLIHMQSKFGISGI